MFLKNLEPERVCDIRTYKLCLWSAYAFVPSTKPPYVEPQAGLRKGSGYVHPVQRWFFRPALQMLASCSSGFAGVRLGLVRVHSYGFNETFAEKM